MKLKLDIQELKILLLVLALNSLTCISSSCVARQESSTWSCPSLPEAFRESDLIGVWVAEYGDSTDTLTIRADGTYKQVFVRPADDFRFESKLLNWWTESIPGGGYYLHLEQMRKCDDIDELCKSPSGGGGDFLWLDFCTKTPVTMKDEVILLVTGVPKGQNQAPRGIWLWHLAASSTVGSYHFTLIQ
jgi:hypothetical protein